MNEEDERLLAIARKHPTLLEAAWVARVERKRLSKRLYMMRRAGVPDVPKFSRGAVPSLPTVLSHRFWFWTLGAGEAHRALTEDPTSMACGMKLRERAEPTSEAEALRVGACPHCWPVEYHPPRPGPLPAFRETPFMTVLAELEVGHGVYLERFGGDWYEMAGDGKPLGETVECVRWWPLKGHK